MKLNSVRNPCSGARADPPESGPLSTTSRGAAAVLLRRTFDLQPFVRDDQLLGQHAGVAGLQRTDLQALGPGGGQLVALDGLALVVVHHHSPALADRGHLAELRVLDPLLEAL